MKQWIKSAIYACISWLLVVNSALSEVPALTEFTRLKPEKPKQIAYYQGGDHDKYHHYLRATIQGLVRQGWIQPIEPPKSTKAKALWSWLSNNVRSNYLRFDSNNFYSADWDQQRRSNLRTSIVSRLSNKQDIDLIIAMGTWAGLDLANNEHTTPTFVISASDPVKSGIVNSNSDSGFDHVFARVAPGRHEWQLRLFHNLIRFNKLGIAFENSVDGKIYAAVDSVKAVAKQRQFDIVECHTQSDIANQNMANESLLACYTELAKNTDAIYVTAQQGVNPFTMPKIVRIMHRHRIPSFSQSGVDDVQKGLLMSLSPLDFKSVGDYLARSVRKVLSGAKPRELTQLFEEERNIAINLKSAELIGMYLNADVLAAADIVYDKIESSIGNR